MEATPSKHTKAEGHSSLLQESRKSFLLLGLSGESAHGSSNGVTLCRQSSGDIDKKCDTAAEKETAGKALGASLAARAHTLKGGELDSTHNLETRDKRMAGRVGDLFSL
ncbi:hypothetical protein EYF80_021847 [Liparis tanakae]|uniref:Uncharacterized protein n=1 Tax=Liparis tanakae TaxID=230148 RepID=A0A4Z2HPY8_9TELE|nr:hypothetical protein EYF80_021847 [Liparis tanakae]